MTEVKDALKRQLKLLSERSEKAKDEHLPATDLVNLSQAMGRVADALVAVIVTEEHEAKHRAEETARANRESIRFDPIEIMLLRAAWDRIDAYNRASKKEVNS